MNKLKSLFLGFVKPLIISAVGDLSMLVPILAVVLVSKLGIPLTEATDVAQTLVAAIEPEIVNLINKL